ncbi:MAG: DUF2911 domain-containing protein [Chitinophagaceae bacterium]|nr:DUF2911 domain-containing protein [Chitinophagaceae bacterium]
MKHIFLLAIGIACWQVNFAQLDLPSGGGNPRATISEEVGITSITIKYARPDVSGREGKIWGSLVTYGFSSQNNLTNRPTSPWRAGANDNTIITFEHDVKVEGKDVKAGTYGLHFAVWPDSVMLILSNQSSAWGSFYYEQKDDALRVIVKPRALDKSVEWLKYEFIEHKEKYCTIAMMWEKSMIPFRVDVDVDNIVLSRVRDQVRSQAGFNNLNLVAASNYFLTRNLNLEEALTWSQRAAGLRSFTTFRTLATAYEKLNRLKEADSVMVDALTMANANQYAVYARALIPQKRFDKAISTLQAGQSKFGDVFIINNGLMFVYSGQGDFKKALAAGEKAYAQAPSEGAKKTIEGQLAKLKENKDIN